MKLKIDLTEKILVAIKVNKPLSIYWETIIEKAYNAETTNVDKLLLEKYIKKFNLLIYLEKRKKISKYRQITLFIIAILYFLEAYFISKIYLNPTFIISIAGISILIGIFIILFFTYLFTSLKKNRFK